MSKKIQLKISIFELIAYIVTIGVALWGLTYITLGLFARFLPVDNELAKADQTIVKLFGLGYFYWGVIILAIAAVTLSLVLVLYAKKNDRQAERETRRAARLAQIKESSQAQPSIVDAEVVVKSEDKATPEK
ncbi:MAG TPA: hypothetical protein PKO28_03525 [Bacilli bacterium]|nr:hypothetical protein [Bacilli bacterium]